MAKRKENSEVLKLQMDIAEIQREKEKFVCANKNLADEIGRLRADRDGLFQKINDLSEQKDRLRDERDIARKMVAGLVDVVNGIVESWPN